MEPKKFYRLMEHYGETEKYTAGQVFHAQNFPQKLFVLKHGYVKRYQATKADEKVLELIYGPEHIISLSQLYKKLFDVDQNQDNFIYVYQTMTDVEMVSLNFKILLKELDKDPGLYKDLFYESGIKLRSNILRLASNAIKDDYQKVAHQLVSLAYEFGGITAGDTRKTIELPLPQEPTDLAEQLNISKEVTETVINNLCEKKIIKINGPMITIIDIDLLKDVYL